MNEHERWEGLADALAAEEPLSESDRRFVEGWSDPWVEPERALYDELAAAGQPGPLDPGDRQRAEATLAAFARAQPPERGRGVAVGVGAAVLAVAAAVVLWWAWPAPDSVLVPHAQVDSGTLMLDGTALFPGEPVPVDRWVVARDRACVRVGSGQGCASDRSRLRIHQGALELADGSLTYEGTGSVHTAWGTLESRAGGFELQLSDEGLHVEVHAGMVQLRDDDGATEALEPGQASTRSAAPTLARPDSSALPEPAASDDPAVTSAGPPRRSGRARSTAPSASDLLGAARRHAASGDRGRALATYATLRRQHAGSPEAHAANVSIGELELRRGRAKAALRAFSRYLSHGGGVLAEEAYWGKIRALHRLERTRERDKAIATLRRTFPASVYLGRASKL